MELVACAGKTAQPHAFKAVVNLQMGKAHLDAFALVARFEKGFCPHQSARQVACVLMKIAGDLSRRHVGTALHLERTDIAVELGGAIAKCVAVVHGAGGVQHLVGRADVDASPPVPAKVAARERAVITLAGIANWNMRRDPAANQPAEEPTSPIS